MSHTNPSEFDRELAALGRACREARERRGLSERELADAVRGISLAGLRALEAGKRDLDYECFLRLARVLGVEASTIVLRTEVIAGVEAELDERAQTR